MNWLNSTSLRLRLTLSSVLISITALCGLAYLLNYAVNEHLYEQDAMQIEQEITSVAKLLKQEDALSQVRSQYSRHSLFLVQITQNNDVLFSSDHHSPILQLTSMCAPNNLFYITENGKNYRGMTSMENLHGAMHKRSMHRGSMHGNLMHGSTHDTMPKEAKQSCATSDDTIQGKVKLTVLIDQAHHEIFMTRLHQSILSGIFIVALISGFLTWFATKRGLAPLSNMVEKAQSINIDSLHERVPEKALPSEINELAVSLNSMLARLDQSFQRLVHFSSDIAHELRTPLNTIMTQTHVTLSKPRETEEYLETLYSNVEELDRLTKMVADMLYLARSENGLLDKNPVTVILHNEIQALFEFYEYLAEEKGVTFHIKGNANVIGDQLMLRRVFSNLLSNALRHSHNDSKIWVKITSNTNVKIDVINQGEVIPEESLPFIFDRFYRADSSRKKEIKSMEGVGLGLAITASIIEAHSGTIQAESSLAQTTFSIQLPIIDK